MDTQLIVADTQIATGIATLVVDLFLAAQLFIQRRLLDIAHQDSVREIGFAARSRKEELTLARLTNETLLDAWIKVGTVFGLSELVSLGHTVCEELEGAPVPA